jgi:3-oxoacyl-[acyl-carrier-protein] synthase-3
MSVGISAIEICLPESRMTVDHMAKILNEDSSLLFKEIGVKEKPICSASQQIIELSIEAARKLIQNNSVDTGSIDFVIHASSGIQEKQLWSPAAKIQKEIKAVNAFAFDIQNGCNSGNLALRLAQQLLLADESKSHVLIVVADALSNVVDYTNPIHKCIFGFSDGASAILVTKNAKNNKLLSFAASTNANFADSIYINKSENIVWMNDDEEEDKVLIKEYEEKYSSMIVSALQKINKNIHDVKYIVMNQGDHKLINKLIKRFDLHSNMIFRSHEEYGHLGGTDIFFGLKNLIENKSVFAGDLVVLASSAIGFSWGATVIQI